MLSAKSKKCKSKRPDMPLYVPRALRDKKGDSCYGEIDGENVESSLYSKSTRRKDGSSESKKACCGKMYPVIKQKCVSSSNSNTELNNGSENAFRSVRTKEKGENPHSSVLSKSVRNKGKTTGHDKILQTWLFNECVAQAGVEVYDVSSDSTSVTDTESSESSSDCENSLKSKKAANDLVACSSECSTTDIIEGNLEHLVYNIVAKHIASDEEEFSHIVELFAFPVHFRTRDLLSALTCFKSEDYILKWVDDCHAIVVFSSMFLASQALELDHHTVKIRPLSEGLDESKQKAKDFLSSCAAAKQRPATTAVVAHRLVTNALGLKDAVPREERNKEKKMISEVKQRCTGFNKRRNIQSRFNPASV